MRLNMIKHLRIRVLAMVGVALGLGTVTGAVFACLGDTQTASGSVKASSTATDL